MPDIYPEISHAWLKLRTDLDDGMWLTATAS